MNNMKLATLLCCHNRREKTLACLQGIYDQNTSSDIYLVDDGSTDGTSDAIRESYPEVKLIQGNGSLFWGGGMRLAFSEAFKVGYDYYIWINDDIVLEKDALNTLLNTHDYLSKNDRPNSIVVGSMRDSQTGKLTYGGWVRVTPWRPLKFKLLEPRDIPLECNTINGNCVLIPHSVAEKLGNIDEEFTHRLGDFDYGLRACKVGCSLWIAPGYVGSCSRNPIRGTWLDPNQSLSNRFQNKLGNIRHSSSPKEWMLYAKRHGGYIWVLAWLEPYIYLLVSSFFKKKNQAKA